MWSRTSATTRSSSSSRMTYPHSQVTWLAIDHPFCRRLSGSGLVTILAGKLSKRTLRGMVRIQLCGRFAVVIDGQATESRLPGRQGRLLVAYLAAHRAQPVERTVLLDALWPEGGAGAAGTLTVLLSKVRSLLVPAEIRGRRTLQLELPANSVVDLDIATTSLHSAESAVALRDWRRAWPTALAAQYAARRRFLAEFEAASIGAARPAPGAVSEPGLARYASAWLGVRGVEIAAAGLGSRALVAHAP